MNNDIRKARINEFRRRMTEEIRENGERVLNKLNQSLRIKGTELEPLNFVPEGFSVHRKGYPYAMLTMRLSEKGTFIEIEIIRQEELNSPKQRNTKELMLGLNKENGHDIIWQNNVISIERAFEKDFIDVFGPIS